MRTALFSRAAASAAAIALASPSANAKAVQPDIEQRINPAAENTSPEQAKPPVELPAAPSRVDSKEIRATPIARIEFEGSAAPAEVARAAQKFIGQTTSRETLNALTAAMSAAYKRSPIALFTLVVPEQDFRDGVVQVLIAEGYIESVVLDGETEGRDLHQIKAYAKELTKERPLKRATLERYLSLISDIPGLSVKPSLQLGSRRGAVKLILNLDFKRPTITGGFTNRTTSLVKGGQLLSDMHAYRFLRPGDETQINLAASVNFKDSLYAGLQHSTPFMRDGARLNFGVAWLHSHPNDTPTEGDAQIYSIGAGFPVIRAYKRNLTVSATADALNSDNAAFGAVIAKERTRAARLGASYAETAGPRSFSIALGAAQGLDLLGARTSGRLGDIDFFKTKANAAIMQKAGPRALLRISLQGQWTDDPLPANERMQIGGETYGRAFETSLISADRAFAVVAEPAYRPIKGGHLSKSEVYAFADYARAKLFERAGSIPEQKYDLGSYGAGFRAAFKDNAALEFEAAHPYDQPIAGYHQGWRFSVRWRFKYRP